MLNISMILFNHLNIQRLSPDGKEITPTNRITVENTKSQTTLKIQSVEIRDMGTYIIQAVNDASIEYLNFTLEVLGMYLVDKIYIIIV